MDSKCNKQQASPLPAMSCSSTPFCKFAFYTLALHAQRYAVVVVELMAIIWLATLHRSVPSPPVAKRLCSWLNPTCAPVGWPKAHQTLCTGVSAGQAVLRDGTYWEIMEDYLLPHGLPRMRIYIDGNEQFVADSVMLGKSEASH
jgi:hypothetical protein